MLLGIIWNHMIADLRSARAVVRTAHIVDPSRPDDANDFRYRPELRVIERSFHSAGPRYRPELLVIDRSFHPPTPDIGRSSTLSTGASARRLPECG